MRFSPAVLALLLIAGAGSLGACTGSPSSMKMSETRREAEANRSKLAQLRVGQSRADVLGLLGPPARTEAFRTRDGRSVEVLFYRTQGWTGSAWAAAYGGQKIADTDEQFTPGGHRGRQRGRLGAAGV